MSQTLPNFEQTHPLYDLMLPAYRQNADLYDGGRSVEGGISSGLGGRSWNKYLTQHPYEKDKQYAIRVRRAAYRNYAAPTVDLFASSVMSGATREGIENLSAIAPLLADCDRLGNPPDRFFKAVETRAAAVGADFVLVDMPVADGGALTRKEALEKGIRPYFVRVPASSVVAWDFDADGSLAWAVVKGSRLAAKDGPFSDYDEVRTVTVWRKDGWERYVWDKSEKGTGSYVPDGEGKLNLGVVPLVPFLYEAETPMTGRSVIDDVASLILRVFNQDSELDKMLFDAALPILAAFGLREEEEEVLVKATSYLWRFGDGQARLQYVEPSGQSFAAKRQQIQDDIESIREISLRQTRPRGAGVESAESKRLDAVQISCQLADFARTAASAERRCWEIAAKLAGLEQEDIDGILIKYNESFDAEALRDSLTRIYMELRKSGDISLHTLWNHLGLSEEQVGEEKKRLLAEAAERKALEIK